LQSLAKEHQLTLNTLVQGAWALLLSRYSGETDVVFSATKSCRRSTIAGAESMVGRFINTLPVRVSVPARDALLPWLKKLRAQWVALRDWQHTPKCPNSGVELACRQEPPCLTAS
jgi:non-ribosomal peptide synthetase component F